MEKSRRRWSKRGIYTLIIPGCFAPRLILLPIHWYRFFLRVAQRSRFPDHFFQNVETSFLERGTIFWAGFNSSILQGFGGYKDDFDLVLKMFEASEKRVSPKEHLFAVNIPRSCKKCDGTFFRIFFSFPCFLVLAKCWAFFSFSRWAEHSDLEVTWNERIDASSQICFLRKKKSSWIEDKASEVAFEAKSANWF